MDRKSFLNRCVRLAGAGLLLPWLPGCATVVAVPFERQQNGWAVKKADFGDQDSVLFKPDHLPAPVFLHRLAEGRYVAVLMHCTHRGCEVRPAGTELHCPCHGSAYTLEGKVLEGPAVQSLRRFEVRADEEFVYIQ